MSSQTREIPHHLTAGEGDSGLRLDQFLAAGIAGLSRSRLKRLIETGQVRLGGATLAEAAYRVKPGDRLTVLVPAAAPARPAPQRIPLDIVYEDADLIVIDKPAGLVVHPAPGNPDRTLVNALIAHCGDSLSGVGGERRPGIVHRIDKDTSGLIVAAKNDAAHAGLTEQFRRHSLARAYLALVHGRPRPAAGEIEGNIGRDPRNRKRMAVLGRGGKPARTHYRVERRFGDAFSLVECRLETGRTHQIRVHFDHLGHPLVGDPLYGRSRRGGQGGGSRLPAPVREAVANFPRQALHARLLGFRHPSTGEDLEFESPLPTDLEQLIEILEAAARNSEL